MRFTGSRIIIGALAVVAASVPGARPLAAATGPWYGDASGKHLRAPIVGMAVTPSGHGYWLAGGDGTVLPFGDAADDGGTAGQRLNAPIVGIARTATGRGYWLAAADGGVFSFGDARFFGSMGGVRLNRPVVGIAPTPSGDGYWLAAADGGVFAFGDAPFAGSAANGVDFVAPSEAGGTVHASLLRPVSGIASTSSGRGYWLVATDTGVFAYGDAVCAHCGGGYADQDAVGIAGFPDGKGFVVVRASPGPLAVWPFVADESFGHLGYATFTDPAQMTGPLVAIAGAADGSVYWAVNSAGRVYPAITLQD